MLAAARSGAHSARIAAILCSALMATLASGAVTPDSLPKPTGYVSDLAHVVDPADKDQLETFCASVEQQLGVQFALVTIDTLEGQPIRDFALDVFRKWGVGSKQTNQGVLLLLAIKDRQSDIETGRGIEPYITDGFSGSTLRSMRPDLRAGNYGQALLTAARSMADQIAQGKGLAFNAPGGETVPTEPRRVVHRNRGGIPGPVIILLIFLFLWLLGRMGRGGRGGPYRGGGGGSGLLWGLLLGNLLSGGRRNDGWGGGGWGGGGFGGGGDGGGGGFGGFGGGDAGGGGASSNW